MRIRDQFNPENDLTGALMAYENGELDQTDTETLFQYLVDTGLVWSLQGSYGRTATALLNAGRISNTGLHRYVN